MYRFGHVGAALFCYAPIGAVISALGEPALALVGAVVAVSLSTLPDLDEFLPIDHRGPTHTIWFAASVGLLATALGGIVGFAIGRPVVVAAVVGGAATLAIVSHLLADVITPMGVRPFYPLSTWHYSFDITPAKNPRANTTMLGVGIAFSALCQAFVLL